MKNGIPEELALALGWITWTLCLACFAVLLAFISR